MLIREIYVRNFLSLADTRIKLGKVNIFIGPNASGKSNIIKLLVFLSEVIKEDTLSAMGSLGYSSLKSLFYNFDESNNILIEVYADEVKYTMSIDSSGTIVEESVELRGEVLARRVSPNKVSIPTSKEPSTIPIEASKSILSIKDIDNIHASIAQFKNVLRDIKAYSFIPKEIKGESKVGFSLELSRTGENLATVLHSLLVYDRKRFLTIEEILKSLVPEVEEIDVPLTKDGMRTYICVRERGLSEPLSFANISDGTLRLLAFITALYLGGSVICFEEPENNVHPYLFETLLDLMRKSPSQILITTHSPYLLDKAKLDELKIVVKHREKTTVKDAHSLSSLNKIKLLLEQGVPLGEIWYSGELVE